MTRYSALPLLTLLLSCSTPEPAPIVVQPPGAPDIERLDMDLVHRVDAAIQERFATITQEDMKGLFFGTTRLTPKKRAHDWIFQPQTKSDREMLEQVHLSGWRGAVFVMSPMLMSARGPVVLGNQPWQTQNRDSAGNLGLRCFKERTALRGQDGEVSLEARPVLASRKLCLNCHTRTKPGEPIAAVIYAFVKDRAWVPSPGE